MTPQENRYIQNVGHSAGQVTQFPQQGNGMKKEGGGSWGPLLRIKSHTTSTCHVWTWDSNKTVTHTHIFFTQLKTLFYYKLDTRWYQQNMVNTVVIMALRLHKKMSMSFQDAPWSVWRWNRPRSCFKILKKGTKKDRLSKWGKILITTEHILHTFNYVSIFS